MLVVSSLRSTRDENKEEMESFAMGGDDFGDLSEGNILESINFDDLFVGIDADGDVLPDLEMFAELSGSGVDELEITNSNSTASSLLNGNSNYDGNIMRNKAVVEDKAAGSSDSGTNCSSRGEEIVSKRDVSMALNPSPTPKEGDKPRKSSKNNNPQAKRKVKVDWTPELHRRFVQAVEQLGVDKAVPSRILEIMGIDCLTRHNIASHLQKYRSHRKHLLAREAEAASWSQRRQFFGGGGGKRDVSPWLAPTIGFPPTNHFRPLHVWGHPTMDHSFIYLWPKHLPHSRSPPPYWHHPQHQRAPSAGTPCFAQPLTTTRFGSASATVPGIPPPHSVYKVEPTGIGVPAREPGPRPLLLFDFHPSKESVDAAIGDVLSKPWLPLPLGLKAPAIDSVVGELQRQGIQKIPPTCA